LVNCVWKWRTPLAALVIGGGVLAAANAESLGFLNIDFFPAQVTALDGAVPSDGGSASAPRNAAPAHARAADPGASGAAWNVSGRVLRVAGADLALDWEGMPASADDKTADDPPDNPEFASVSSPVGTAEAPSAARFANAAPIANSLGGSQGGAGGGVGSLTGETATSSAPAASTAPAPVQDDPLQAVAAPTVVAGPVPEPGAWVSMILGLGLVGAMLRSGRRRRTA
jgi:hypothetical protein